MGYKNQIISYVFLLLNQVAGAQVMTPTEWCPPGTWWTYKNQTTMFSRDKTHEIYIYKKDTLDNNRTVKKVEIYQADTDIPDAFNPVDSFISPIIYKGYLLMYIQNDSVFANISNHRSNFSYIFISNVVRKDEYVFLYRFNTQIGDKTAYRRKLLDTAYCEREDSSGIIDTFNEVFYVYDTLTKIVENDYNYNLYGRDCKIRITQNKSSTNHLFGYQYLYENLAPYDYFYNIPRLDTFYDTADKYVFRRFCQPKGGVSVYDWGIKYELYCYYQGGQGHFMNRHWGGKEENGCKYVEQFIKDKLNIRSNTQNEIKIYPNPAQNILYIEGLDFGSSIFVYNNLGKLVFSNSTNLKKESLSLDNLSKGHYYINIYNKNNELIKNEKIIKEN